MFHSKEVHFGEFMLDHRASPGNWLAKEGQVIHGRILGCPHCGGGQVLNPFRERPREYCRACDKYICDSCHVIRCHPDYKHRTFLDVVDMVQSGRWKLMPGSTAGLPILEEVTIHG
jgi:hypothetical protein